MKNVLSMIFGIFAIGFASAQDGLPANPKPGSCYVRCITSDEFKTVEERIMVKPEYTKLEVVPATYKTVEERVLIKEATKKMIYVAAVYETVDVPYVQKQSRTDLSITPATFSPATEVREIYPATSGWEYTSLADCKSPNPGDCQVLCYVEKPAASSTTNVQRLASAATTVNNMVPEIGATYKKQVIKTPARMDEVEIPAEYTTIKKQVIDVPASTKTITVPAEYVTITKTEIAKKGGITTYSEIDCKLVNYSALPILYDLGSAALTSKAKSIIDENLYKLMVAKPEVSVEIASHTDSRSDDTYNMSLSQRRAESVVNYLVGKGIKRSRLVAKGFGESKLKNRCANGVECTEAEHQQNRRTEFRVIDAK
ncbi:MAG: OmpA family protein [Saprospiraceae bacterium]|nr:OmpA family protein [Saprospiraceae bacterium]